MADHRTPKKRRATKAIIAAAATAGVSSTLVLGHAVNYTAANLDMDLTATVLGLGGRGDPMSERVAAKLGGMIGPGFTVPGATEYKAVPYPADFNFLSSQTVGVTNLETAIEDAPKGHIRVVGYSEGTLVAEEVKRRLADQNGPLPDIDFLFIASPYLPNGGLFARFPGFRVPGLLPEFGPAEAGTGFESTYVTNEYDTYADFPAYFNPLSIANALLSIRYAHPDEHYDAVEALDPKFDPKNPPAGYLVKTSADGKDTYILVRAEHLPLLAPVRELAGILQITPLTEPVLAAIEPMLRLAVDAGYTDRENRNPEKPTPFSLFTPPQKIVEALAGVPGALQEGIHDATSPDQDSLQDSPVTSFRAPGSNGEDQLRIAGAPDPQPQPKTGDGSSTDLLVDPNETAPKPKPQVKPKLKTPVLDAVANAVRQIIHPKVTKDGNKAVPGTTAGGTTTTGGGTVTPITANSSGAQDGSSPTPPSQAGSTPADNNPPADKVA